MSTDFEDDLSSVAEETFVEAIMEEMRKPESLERWELHARVSDTYAYAHFKEMPTSKKSKRAWTGSRSI
jgi:hypothetical protein